MNPLSSLLRKISWLPRFQQARYVLRISTFLGMIFLGSASSNFAQAPMWTQKFPAVNPGPRYGQAMAYDSAHGQVVLFGGRSGTTGLVLGDTWVWDGVTWTQKFPANSPSVRGAHDMVYDTARGQVVLFGGSDGPHFFNETWVWDGTNWTQKFPASVPPARISSRFLAYDSARQEVVMFGGGIHRFLLYNDTWVWDGNNWTQKFPATAPLARATHGMAYDVVLNQIVLFAGSGVGDTALNDTWVWDGTNWTQKFPATSPPTPRQGAGMVYDQAQGNVLLFGGSGFGGIPTYGDTWVWDGTNWIQLFPATSPAPRLVTNAVAYDAAHRQIVLFGGADLTSFFGDTWVWGSANQPPLANAGPDQSLLIGETMQLDGTASFDPDGSIIQYEWELGDGYFASGGMPQHSYSSAGVFTVILTVTDNEGKISADDLQVTVKSLAQALADLTALVASFNLQQGIANSLDAKLQNAIDALDAAKAGNRQDTANKLQSFINAVEAQRGKELTDALADQLIALARRIMAVL